MLLPVTHPGVEQKATWLQIRQQRPDYVFLWGWGVMNSTAIKEAVATGYPRDKMYGVWWSGAEPDVSRPATAPRATTRSRFLAPRGTAARCTRTSSSTCTTRARAPGRRRTSAQVLYNRGMVAAMMTVEAVRSAQSKYGKKPLTGEEVRWGLENLAIDEARIKELGFERLHAAAQAPPATTTRAARAGELHTWDGKKWNVISRTGYEADMKIIEPMIRASAEKYAQEKKITQARLLEGKQVDAAARRRRADERRAGRFMSGTRP